jgi:hypothetical protein
MTAIAIFRERQMLDLCHPEIVTEIGACGKGDHAGRNINTDRPGTALFCFGGDGAWPRRHIKKLGGGMKPHCLQSGLIASVLTGVKKSW